MFILRRIVTCHWLVALLLMGVFGAIFSLALINLVSMLDANLRLISRYGTMVLFQGALRQFGELALMGYGSIITYILFKACETTVLDRLLGRGAPVEAVSPQEAEKPKETAAAHGA